MLRIVLLLIVVELVACTKRDLPALRKIQETNACTVVSMNADKQDTEDFFVIKTFNQYGSLVHITTQTRDIYDATYLHDYDITYTPTKAIFKGSTRTYYWYYDDPENPDATRYREEQHDLLDTLDFEILLDPKTRHAVEVRYAQSRESILKLAYNNQGFLSKVADYNVKTDERGNILSILTPPYEGEYYHGQQLGVWYGYSDSEPGNGSHQYYYEAGNIVIHKMYSFLEILNWGPFQPDRERTTSFIQHDYGDEYYPVQPALEIWYDNHQYDAQGYLVGYTFHGDFVQPVPYSNSGRHLTRTIRWRCGGSTMK